MAELGERIRALRQRQEWTLKDLAKRTGLSVPYLSDIERRREMNPTLETLNSIASALGCELSELVAVGDGGALMQEMPLPISLQRFVRGDNFSRRLDKLAARAGREPDDMRREVINFLANAPKRAAGDLGTDDWLRLLDFYAVIIEE